MKSKLTPRQADHLFHRLKQIKHGGLCEQYICPDTLGGALTAKCGICFKLVPEMGLKDWPIYYNFFSYEKRCPCYIDKFKTYNQNQLPKRALDALRDFYGEEVEI